MAENNEAVTSEMIKLTITMLVSNRISTIRKCMDSIAPLLKKLPSELIVVDTGSTDGSIDVVREYTDKIIPFKWCNDFAAARNAGLEDARGEWFMFLDDDEWFEDVTEIVDFFKSGEYKKYNRGVYLVRNYGNAKATEWMDSSAPRMSARLPEIRFEGVVHEVIAPVKGPTKYFSAYAHHYGYVYATAEEQRAHFHRNITLMQKALELDPGDIRMLAQEVQEYFGMGELYKTRDLCKRVVELCRNRPLERPYAGYCYTISLRVYMRMESWEKAYSWGEKILAEGAPTSMALLATMREMVTVCRMAKKYPEGVRCAKKYLELYDSLDGKVNKEEICFDLSRYFQEEEHDNACLEGISLAVMDKDWKTAEIMLLKKNWESSPLLLYQKTLDHIMELWTVTKFRQKYADILDRILKCGSFRKQIWNNMVNYAVKDRAAYLKLLRIFGSCKDNSVMTRKYHFLYLALSNETSENATMKRILEELWEESANPLLLDTEIWDAIDDRNLSLLQAVKNTAYDQWFIQVRQWLETARRTGLDGINAMAKVYHILCRDTEESDDLRIQFMELKYQEGVMRERLTGDEDILSCLETHCNKVLEFYARFYRQEIFHEKMATLLPPEGAFAVYVRQALQSREKGDQKAYVQFIGKAAKCYPVMKELCKTLLQQESDRNRITDEEQVEFALLARQLKHNAKTLLKNNNKEAAKQIILQLKALLPEDEELLNLENMINA